MTAKLTNIPLNKEFQKSMLRKGEEAQDAAEYTGAPDMGLGQEGLRRIATSQLRHKEWGQTTFLQV